MPKFCYDIYMRCPICRDAGEITEVIPERSGCGYSPIGTLVADGQHYACDTKLPIFYLCNFVFFRPWNPADVDDGDCLWRTEYRRLPENLRDGTELEIAPHIHYTIRDGSSQDGKSLGEPICTDPRVLCIMHRSWFLPKSPDRITDSEMSDICGHIPSREEALAYVKKVGLAEDCLPVDWIDSYIRRRYPEKYKVVYPTYAPPVCEADSADEEG